MVLNRLAPSPLLLVLLGTLTACASTPPPAPLPAPPPAVIDGPAPTIAPTQASADPVAEHALDRVFTADSRTEQALDPQGALERGEPVDPARFRLLFTPQLTQLLRESNADTLARLSTINRASLGDAHRLSYDVFLRAKRDEQAALAPDAQALLAVRPFTHFGGFHVEFPQLAAAQGPASMDRPEDFENRIAVLRALPTVFDQAIARFREGMASGAVEPRLTVANMIAQIDAILAVPARRSPFVALAQDLPSSIPARTRRRISADFLSATTGSVYPAYRTLRTFLATEYLPAARPEPGLSAIRGGDRLYRLLVRQHTTLDLDPDAVHRLGLSEVARIQAEMDKVKQQLGFTGSLRAFFEDIRTNPRYHPRSVGELQRAFVAVGDKVTALAPRYFNRVPATPLVIEPYPLFRDRFEAGGGYAPGAPDASKPGVFFFNTFDLRSRYLTGVTTLYLHEGEPGHHFQISLAQENESLPDFQRFGGNTAFVEGWALYAETPYQGLEPRTGHRLHARQFRHGPQRRDRRSGSLHCRSGASAGLQDRRPHHPAPAPQGRNRTRPPLRHPRLP
ncbi:MAG: hypothetical protein RIS94_3189 [Pseudomonadota bacterium]